MRAIVPVSNNVEVLLAIVPIAGALDEVMPLVLALFCLGQHLGIDSVAAEGAGYAKSSDTVLSLSWPFSHVSIPQHIPLSAHRATAVLSGFALLFRFRFVPFEIPVDSVYFYNNRTECRCYGQLIVE